jgi:hypothetical protein
MMADSVKYAKCKWASVPSTAAPAINAFLILVGRNNFHLIRLIFNRTYCSDHHCPWLGTCIGGRNYSAFLAYTVFYAILLLASALLGMGLEKYKKEYFLRSSKSCKVSLRLSAFSAAFHRSTRRCSSSPRPPRQL